MVPTHDGGMPLSHADQGLKPGSDDEQPKEQPPEPATSAASPAAANLDDELQALKQKLGLI